MPEPVPASIHAARIVATATADKLLLQQQQFNNPPGISTTPGLLSAGQASVSGEIAAGMAIAPGTSPRATAQQEYLG